MSVPKAGIVPYHYSEIFNLKEALKSINIYLLQKGWPFNFTLFSIFHIFLHCNKFLRIHKTNHLNLTYPKLK